MSSMSSDISILVVDDHTLLREALSDILLAEQDFRVVGAAGDGDTAVALATQTRPDVVLLDIEMPPNQPARTVRRLHGASPTSKVIILSMHDDPQLVRDLLEIGICGYLHKSVGRRDLANAIRAARDDDQRVTILVSRETATQVSKAGPGVLTTRELEILALVAKAMSNRQIATQLAISEGTVKRHLRNVFGKLGAVSRIDAVNKAARTTRRRPGPI